MYRSLQPQMKCNAADPGCFTHRQANTVCNPSEFALSYMKDACFMSVALKTGRSACNRNSIEEAPYTQRELCVMRHTVNSVARYFDNSIPPPYIHRFVNNGGELPAA